MTEYRICWSASSNASFRGAGDWNEWGGHEESEAEIEDALTTSEGPLPQGLEEALEFSGFEWWVEFR